MRRRSPPRLDEAAWEASLLSADTEALLATVRNYLGPVKTPYDKRALVGKLGAFLKRPETREALFGLLDLLDARILGTLLLLGAASEAELRDLFSGELPLFDFGLRLANLQDRLLLLRFEQGRESLLAVNPLLAEAAREAVLDPGILFGPEAEAWEEAEGRGAREGEGEGGGLDAALATAFFGFLFHAPASIRRGGGLTKRGKERASLLFPGLGRPDGLFDALTEALFAASALARTEEGEAQVDPAAFGGLLEAWGEGLPYRLAAALAGGEGEEAGARDPRSLDLSARLLIRSLSELPRGIRLSRAGLLRWLGLRKLRELPGEALPPPAALVRALEALGLLRPSGLALLLTDLPPALGAASSPEAGGGAAAAEAEATEGPAREAAGEAAEGRGPVLVAEGSHLLHLLPEASLAERLFLLLLAEPRVLGKVWSLEIGRESARRAFSTGLGAEEAMERLGRMAGRSLPQSLSFSIKAWEEEYRSLRLYHGFVLAADERQRKILEGSGSLRSLLAERLGPGLYLLSARSYEEAAAALAAAGLEAPPESRAATGASRRGARSAGFGPGAAEAGSPADPGASGGLPPWSREAGGGGSGARPLRAPDPRPRLAELRAALEAFPELPPERRRELSDRIDRRLILGVEQLELAELRLERLEAVGLDYLGKVRVVERALRGRGDRLEVLYRLPGADPVRALLRPVRLDKTEKGLVLEAEDLGSGGPVRVPLGAASLVRRLRASLFGEDT